MAADPWKTLRIIGFGAFGLASLSAFRFFPFDWPGIAASLWCSLALLRRRSSSLLATAIAGGIVLADSMVSLVLMGPLLLRRWARDYVDGWYQDDGLLWLTLQLTLYCFQICFWPWAVSFVLRNMAARGIVNAYAVHTRDTVIGAFCVAAWISLVLQLWAKVVVYRLI